MKIQFFSLRLEGNSSYFSPFFFFFCTAKLAQLAARNLLRMAREHLDILCTTLEEMQWALTMVNDG